MTSRSSKSLAEAKPRPWQTGLVVCMNRYPLGALGKLPSGAGVVGRACSGDTQVPLPLLVRIQSQPELHWHIHDPPKERLRLAEALPDRSPFPPSVSWVSQLFWGQNSWLRTPFPQITSSFPFLLLILQFPWSSWAPSCAQNLNWFSENSGWLMISSDGPGSLVIFWGWINLVDNYGFSDP